MVRFVALSFAAVAALLVGSCGGGSSGPSTSDGACAPPEHLSGDVLATAQRDHPPTLEERKAAAVLWVMAAVAAQSDGQVADVFALSDVGARLGRLGEAYAKLSTCEGAEQALTKGGNHAAMAALSSCSDFACESSCWPDASVFGSAAGPAWTLLKKIGGKLAPPPTGEKPPLDWNALYMRMHKTVVELAFNAKDDTRTIAKRVGDALVNGLSEDDAKAIEKIVSTVVSTSKDIAAARAKTGASAALIAEVCSGLEAGLLAKQLADGLEPARQLVADCWLFKSRYCGADPPCSNPDPCAKLIGNACLFDSFRAPDGASDFPGGCVDRLPGGDCQQPSMDGGPVDAGSDASLEPIVDSGSNGGDGGPGVDDRCCACTFDVYCTVYGPGGCWYCDEGTYVGETCNAVGTLAAPGPCSCDPSLYYVCQ